MQRITIYTPPGVPAETLRQLRVRYPTAEFITKYQIGAILWQDAIK